MSGDMTDKPRFTLKAILICTTIQCISLAMFAAGNELWILLLPFTLFGCGGFLIGRAKGCLVGLAIVFLAIWAGIEAIRALLVWG